MATTRNLLLPLDHPDLPLHLAANDNGEDDLDDLESSPRARTDALLAIAGFDPDAIPLSRRRQALRVARCFQDGMVDDADVAHAARCSEAQVRKILAYLHAAALPGTEV